MPTPSTTPPAPRSTSRPRLPSRPTTPLRPSSRSSLRASQQSLLDGAGAGDRAQSLTGASAASASAGEGGEAEAAGVAPLAFLEPPLAEFSDAMADLEANLLHLALLHESLARFGESFASFLYGLNVNAFCVDFPEVSLGFPTKKIVRVWSDGFVGSDCRVLRPRRQHRRAARRPCGQRGRRRWGRDLPVRFHPFFLANGQN
jgi:DASH complex subunit Dam1